MSGELLALLLAVGVPVGLRLLDYFFPKGRYFKWVDRYAKPDKVIEDDDEDEGVDDGP